MKSKQACRIYVILATDGRSAAVFRKGPRNNTLLLRWWLKDDTFEEGQWIKHKIYVRRCDLSPNGDLLVYFAARHAKPLYSWTAISRMPNFKALALWPKTDSWGGGGLFSENNQFSLNHAANEMQPDPERPLPKRIKLTQLGDHSGRGEDFPIHRIRELRDRWTVESDFQAHMTMKSNWEFASPVIVARQNPKLKFLILKRIFKGFFAPQEKTYMEDFQVCNQHGEELMYFNKTDWADWDSNGDLLIGNDGRLWRFPVSILEKKSEADSFEGCKLLIDLRDRVFDARVAPEWASYWP
jgi:hypothetical protein